MRRLRFPLDLEDDESIPGAIARGVGEHGLLRTKIVVDEAGAVMKHAGLAQLARPDELRRIAHVIRCDEQQLVDRRGERLTGDSDRQMMVRIGGLVFPSKFLGFDRRRVGPRSLAKSDYHRVDWLNLLLPYDPVTLERLVDHCSLCETDLEWRNIRGVGICEICEQPVPASSEPDLGGDLVDDYRAFARLFTLRHRAESRGFEELGPILEPVGTNTILRLALHLGSLDTDNPVATSSNAMVAEMPAPVLAGVVARGTVLLRNWPNDFQKWVGARADELNHDTEALNLFRRRLLRLTDRWTEKRELIELAVSALPDLEKHGAHKFSLGKRYYLNAETQNRLGLDSHHIARLRAWPELRARVMPVQKRTFAQFDADQIDELAPIFRGADLLISCRDRFHIPIYGIEQLIGRGLLLWEGHPAFVMARNGRYVKSESIDALERRLLKARRRGTRPASAVTLSVASRRIGGRPKPWGSIVEALVERRIPFWIDGPIPTTTHIMVDPRDIAQFDGVLEPTQRPEGFVGDEIVSQFDAGELLNVQSLHIPRISASLDIPVARNSRSLVSPLRDILATASRTAWKTEIGWHLGTNPSQVDAKLEARGVAKHVDGWSRAHLIEEGILPPVG